MQEDREISNLTLGEYKEIALVSDESFPHPGRTYTIQNPLCKTAPRALKIAESLLAAANRDGTKNEDLLTVPRFLERILHLDSNPADFRRELQELERYLFDNPFLRATPVVSPFREEGINLREGDPGGS